MIKEVVNMSKKIINVSKFDFRENPEDPYLARMHHLDLYPQGNGEMGVPKELLKDRNLGEDFDFSKDWKMYYGKEVPGFPAHPHRGFETVTIVLQGYVDHADSAGQSGKYGAGDVQWMTAGKGMQHSEMFPLVYEDQDNTLELFQVWLNLPAKDKFVEPSYKMLWSEAIPKVIQENEQGQKSIINVIAGCINETKSLPPNPDSWANKKENHVGIYTVKMEPEASFTLPKVSSTLNRNLYFYRGANIHIDGQVIGDKSSLKLVGDEEVEIINGKKESHLLVLEGEPINEPVVNYGPFVMNTFEEIQQAYQDYQETQFGGWPWEVNYHVTPIEVGRFAKHAEEDQRPPEKFF